MALSNTGKQTLALIRQSLNVGDTFKARDLKLNAASLITLLNDGYIQDLGGKPKTYKVIETKERITIKTNFAPYSFEEWQLQITMLYQELCNYLRQKYGIPDGSYFLTDTCKTQNKRITRGTENLAIHHIKEDTAIDLSKTEQAIAHPWEYQQPQNLVYANPYEHLILHMLIAYEYQPIEGVDNAVGIGGVLNWLAPKLLVAHNNFLSLDIDYIIEQFELTLQTRPIYQNIENTRKFHKIGKMLSELSENEKDYPYPQDDISNSDSFIETIHKRTKYVLNIEAVQAGTFKL